MIEQSLQLANKPAILRENFASPGDNGKSAGVPLKKAGSGEHLYLRHLSDIFSESYEVANMSHKSEQIFVIELAPSELRLLFLRRFGKKYQMESWYDYSTAESDAIDFKQSAEHIRHFIKQSGIKKPRVILCVYGPDIFVRTLTVSLSGGHTLQEAAFWAIKEELPVFSEHDLWDYQVISEAGDQGKQTVKILAAVVQESSIRNHLDVLKRLDIYPEQIVPKPVALSCALQMLTHPTVFNQKDFVIVDLGREKTLLCFYNKGVLNYVRTISTGVNQIDVSLKLPLLIQNRNFRLRQEKIEKFKKDYGLTPILSKQKEPLKFPFNKLYAQLSPVLKNLVSEISRSFLYYGQQYSSAKINAVFLTGKAGGIKSLNHYLSEQTGIPVFYLAPKIPLIRIGNFINESEFTSLFGAACMRKDVLNLIPNDIKINQRYRRLRKFLNYTLSALIIFLSGTGVVLNTEKTSMMEKLNSYHNRMEHLHSAEQLHNQLVAQSNNQESQQLALRLALHTNKTMADQLKIFSNFTPDDIVLTSLKTKPFIKDDGKANTSVSLLLEGKIYKNSVSADFTLLKFVKALKSETIYKTIEINKKRNDPEHQSLIFELNLQVP